MLANEFVPTPVSALAYLQDAGLLGMHGPDVTRSLAYLLPRFQRVVGPVQEVTSATSRVTVNPGVVDSFGVPVAHLSGGLHPEDLRARAFLNDKAVEWLRSSGAARVVEAPPLLSEGPSSGQHQAGTARMGTSPSNSVTDPWGRVWGHDNVRVVDASTHVTNGGVNPALTIFANSLRVMSALR